MLKKGGLKRDCRVAKAPRKDKGRAWPNLYAVILAGGSGSRFWPLSRETSPKQVLTVAGDESLLRLTIKRLHPLIPDERTFIVTSAAQAEVIRLHLISSDRPVSPAYIIEPEARNTAPAIGLAAIEIARLDPEALLLVLPADHIIEDGRHAFLDAVSAGADVADEGRLVTFGIKPSWPHTGYGYIKAGKKTLKKVNGFVVRAVDRFVEKPDAGKARRFIKEGSYFWNSGMFLCRASLILEEIKRHLPKVHARLSGIKNGSDIGASYRAMEAVSIDHGVLEKTERAAVLPVDFRWSDMGSWTSLRDVLEADKDGNIIQGRAIDIGSRDSIIIASNRIVATIGLKDMIVVDTADATLVCPADKAEEVKKAVDVLKKHGHAEHHTHRTVERPWGFYTVLEKGIGYKIKKIRVEPGKRLSLQLHHKRSEHWVVISGRARAQRGEETVDIEVNQSTYIPRGVRHRLENPWDKPLEIIEVQNGEYVEEDDIVRYDDDFKRV